MNSMNELEDIFEYRRSTPPLGIERAIGELSDKPIILYGAGAFGAENFTLLKKYGVTPFAFLDKNAKPNSEKMGIPVYHPDDDNLSRSLRENCSVLISITIPSRIMTGIKNDLRNWGYNDCTAVQSVTARQILFDDTSEENPDDDYFELNKEKIKHVFGCMADEESRETYISSIRAHLLRKYEDAFETASPVQYFDAGVPLEKGLSHFVDCGAYNGDTLSGALRYCDSIETYTAFEPIMSNFAALSLAVDEQQERVSNAYLFPCGLADRSGYARFTAAASSSAITKNDTGDILPLVRMDDVIKNAPVSFLKMDIEGAELIALRGAENIIKKQSPDLAISVYHYVNHYWDIPFYLSQINPKYRFYLRAHTAATLESVLYCCE